MDFELWEKYYTEILKDFGFSREEDEASAKLLMEHLRGKEPPLEEIKKLIHGKVVWVVGNSPTLDLELGGHELEGTIIAADDSVSVLLAGGISPHIIVTDLDSDIDDLVHAYLQGSIMVIHAHGDNKEAINDYSPLFLSRVIGTTQSKPFDDIHNFGGFTDGDRAVFLADHFGAAEIRLVGFDFKNINPEKDDETKRKKLDWAYLLIQSLDNPNIIF